MEEEKEEEEEATGKNLPTDSHMIAYRLFVH